MIIARAAMLRSIGLRQTDPDVLDLDHDGTLLRIALRRRPAARRLTLRVSNATGEVIMTLPMRTSLAAARKFAASHGGWIAARLARVPERVPFEPEARIPLRGVVHRIVRLSGRGLVRATNAEGEAIIGVTCDAVHLPRRVRDFLQREARQDLTAAVTRYAGRLGVRPTRITIRDTRSRWGSCTAGGALNFSWRLILAPPLVLDYLVAHEVAHLKEMNHSARFWAVVRGICPNVDEAETWLKRHGSELHRYG